MLNCAVSSLVLLIHVSIVVTDTKHNKNQAHSVPVKVVFFCVNSSSVRVFPIYRLGQNSTHQILAGCKILSLSQSQGNL